MKMPTNANTILTHQSGAALVIALVLLVVITLAGLASSYTSIFEIMLSGTKRASTNAFYAADTGINGMTTNIANFNLNLDSYKTTHQYRPFSDPANVTPNPTKVAGPTAPITNIHTQSGPPRGMGFSALNLSYAYYEVRSVGKDQATLTSQSSATIQEEVVRLLPATQ
jgi:hypothetical protein